MKITFWGVLGSYGRWQPAQPSLKSTDNNNHNTSNLHEPLNIGGHTSCILIEKTTPSDSDSDNETSKTPFLILDAGSGLIPLGKQLCANQKQDNDSKQGSDSKTDCHLLITHPHLDHVSGIPFFAGLWKKNYHLHFYQSPHTHHLESVLKDHLICPPLFPLTLDQVPSQLSFHTIEDSKSVALSDDFSASTLPLHHPGGACGYCIHSSTKKLVYITDHEHSLLSDEKQSSLKAACQNADLIIFDTMYDEHDLKSHQGWGHSSWREACDFARAVNAKRLALFHLNPDYSDEQLLDIEQRAKDVFQGAFLARERQSVVL